MPKGQGTVCGLVSAIFYSSPPEGTSLQGLAKSCADHPAPFLVLLEKEGSYWTPDTGGCGDSLFRVVTQPEAKRFKDGVHLALTGGNAHYEFEAVLMPFDRIGQRQADSSCPGCGSGSVYLCGTVEGAAMLTQGAWKIGWTVDAGR